MTESEQDILDRLDVLVAATLSNDNDYVIQALEQYDTYMRTRVPNSNGVFATKFSIKGAPKFSINGAPKVQNNVKDCSVVLTRLPDYILDKYTQNKPTNCK